MKTQRAALLIAEMARDPWRFDPCLALCMQECPCSSLGPNQLTVMTHDAGHLTKSPSSTMFAVFLASGENCLRKIICQTCSPLRPSTRLLLIYHGQRASLRLLFSDLPVLIIYKIACFLINFKEE